MGKVLYREYRPKLLSDVVGQKHITDTLSAAVEKGAIAHAYLFTGPRGVGKTSVARILAHAINGLTYHEESNHLDIIEIDAASNRRIDEIRDLREKVHIAPSSAKYKVYIIDEVHMLTREAFNALLKTLEEPPEHAVFILATTEAHKIPETIISRTQRFSFKPIDTSDAVEHLRRIADQEKIHIDEEALQLLATYGKGSFRDSISMLDQMTGFGKDTIDAVTVRELLGIPNDTLLERLLESLQSGDSDGLFQTTMTLRTQGAHPSTIAQSLITYIRDQIAHSRPTLPVGPSIQFMKGLLALTASHASYEALEVVLLENLIIENTTEKHQAPTKIPKSSIETADEAPKQSNSNKKPASSKEEATEALLENKEIVSAEELSQTEAVKKHDQSSGKDSWSAILEALKGHHNTLYGVLRMAQAEVRDDVLVLQFKFAFHHKQASQEKHRKILHDTAESIYGKKIKIDFLIDASGKKSAAKPEPKVIDQLKSVSNIFGGAELLES